MAAGARHRAALLGFTSDARGSRVNPSFQTIKAPPKAFPNAETLAGAQMRSARSWSARHIGLLF
jgi:hypothetical protein